MNNKKQKEIEKAYLKGYKKGKLKGFDEGRHDMFEALTFGVDECLCKKCSKKRRRSNDE
jgi:flagellar biosynthesis/type III secretory pathway protein FliH